MISESPYDLANDPEVKASLKRLRLVDYEAIRVEGKTERKRTEIELVEIEMAQAFCLADEAIKRYFVVKEKRDKIREKYENK